MKKELSSHRLYVYRVQSKNPNILNKRFRPEEKFIKIGITSQKRITDRYDLYPDGFVEFYSKSLMTSQRFNTRAELFKVEQLIHKALKGCSYRPNHRFSGYTECYLSTPNTRKLIKSIIWGARVKFTPDTPL